jgi:hypothetical protein
MTMTTTTSDRPVEAQADAAVDDAATRFAEGLGRLHGSLTYAGLADAIEGEPLCRLDGLGDGLTTVTFLQSQLPERYLRGILGFRLAQFLQTGLIDPELVHRRAMFHEPIVQPTGPETIHTVTLTETGKIVGYIGMVASPDPEPLALDAPERGRFPVESAHGVELLSAFAAPGRTTHDVYEVKRFVRDRAMPRGPQRDRVAWHLILANGHAIASHRGGIQVVLGDSGERGALRHLRLLLGMDLVVIEGTTPSLPRTELMWPSYFLPPERLAKPFVGEVPSGADEYLDVIGAALRRIGDDEWQQHAIAGIAELHSAAGRLEAPETT